MTKGKSGENPNKKKIEEYDCVQIVSLGKSFLNAAKKCNDPLIERVGWSHQFFVPIVTNTAFACELFMKALLMFENNPMSGHKLILLFDSLSNNRQKEIIGLEDEKEFKDKLESISNLFEEWRYVYEQRVPYVQYDFLCCLSDKLLLIVDEL